jgi:hypothetical protein
VGSSPLAGDDLPELNPARLRVREAAPSPAPGPVRDALAAVTDARARRAEEELAKPLQAYLDRAIGVVRARLKGPKGRKGTRWWDVETKGGNSPQRSFRNGPPEGPHRTEVKALDPGYILPDKITEELAEELPTAALRIATEAATDTATRLASGDEPDLGAFDSDEIAAAVEEAVSRILGVADRHARELRAAILDADREAADLDEVFDRIEEAHRRGGNWVLMSGRTLANALANDAAYRQAARLGVTHAQWISRRDERVRRTHAHPTGADGQVRRLGDRFQVGAFKLRFPGDPTDLPASWSEVANCRCGLLFRKPDKDTRRRLGRVFDAAADAASPGQALDVLRRALDKAAAAPDGPVLIPAPTGMGLPPVAALVTLGRDIVAYRVLADEIETVPGQTITTSSALALALAPAAGAAATLAVLIPAGAVVGVATAANGTAVILPNGATMEVLGAGVDGVRAVLTAEQPETP